MNKVSHQQHKNKYESTHENQKSGFKLCLQIKWLLKLEYIEHLNFFKEVLRNLN